MMNEPVSTIMTSYDKLITHKPTDDMAAVQATMQKHRLHHLPIVEDGKLVGLITTTDLLKMNKRFEEYAGVPVSRVMTTRLAKLEGNAKVGTAATIFLENLFHLLPVVDDSDKLVGIVTTFDVLKYSFKKAYPGDDFPFL